MSFQAMWIVFSQAQNFHNVIVYDCDVICCLCYTCTMLCTNSLSTPFHYSQWNCAMPIHWMRSIQIMNLLKLQLIHLRTIFFASHNKSIVSRGTQIVIDIQCETSFFVYNIQAEEFAFDWLMWRTRKFHRPKAQVPNCDEHIFTLENDARSQYKLLQQLIVHAVHTVVLAISFVRTKKAYAFRCKIDSQ